MLGEIGRDLGLIIQFIPARPNSYNLVKPTLNRTTISQNYDEKEKFKKCKDPRV